MTLSYKQKLKTITTFILDVDGVLTDGKVFLHPSGEFLRAMSTRDGLAIKMATDNGFNVFVITGGKSNQVKIRMEKLGAQEIHLGVDDKLPVFENIIKKHNLNLDEILYMGDDLPDFYPIKKSGVGCCPEDAAEEIKAVADYVSHFKGGAGCVRDVIEQTLKIHGKWNF